MAALATPRIVEAVLGWRATWLVARLLLVGAYFEGGLTKISDFPSAVAEQMHFGMQPAVIWAAVTIAVELIGSLLILSSVSCSLAPACSASSRCWPP